MRASEGSIKFRIFRIWVKRIRILESERITVSSTYSSLSVYYPPGFTDRFTGGRNKGRGVTHCPEDTVSMSCWYNRLWPPFPWRRSPQETAGTYLSMRGLHSAWFKPLDIFATPSCSKVFWATFVFVRFFFVIKSRGKTVTTIRNEKHPSNKQWRHIQVRNDTN